MSDSFPFDPDTATDEEVALYLARNGISPEDTARSLAKALRMVDAAKVRARKEPTPQWLIDSLETGRLEAAANEEYRRGRYPSEEGGPALKALNAHRAKLRAKPAPTSEACRICGGTATAVTPCATCGGGR